MVIWMWIGFFSFLLVMIGLDLKVFHRTAKEMGIREAIAWTLFWIVLALGFTFVVSFIYDHYWFGEGFELGLKLTGKEAALQFLTGFLVEKSLSIDMFLLIALVFSYFSIPLKYQYHLLYWGVIGAFILRAAALFAGTILIIVFNWVTYIFGIFLLISATRMLIVRHDNLQPQRNLFVILAKRYYPISNEITDEEFFTEQNGVVSMTPLFLVFLLIQSINIAFSIDAVPAIIAITQDPFLVLSANAFAMLGLVPLYFTLAAYLDRLQYFKMSLVFVMAFVAVNLLLRNHYQFPTAVSLAVIGGMLSVGTVASFFARRRDTAPLLSPLADELGELAMMTLRQARRISILLIGSSVVLVGIALIVLPGPAFIVIPAGLAILATEFIWARQLLKKMKGKVYEIGGSFLGSSSQRPEKPESLDEGESKSPDLP